MSFIHSPLTVVKQTDGLVSGYGLYHSKYEAREA